LKEECTLYLQFIHSPPGRFTLTCSGLSISGTACIVGRRAKKEVYPGGGLFPAALNAASMICCGLEMLNMVMVKLVGLPPSPPWYRTTCAGLGRRRLPDAPPRLRIPRKRLTNSGISSFASSRCSRCSRALIPSLEVRQSGQTSTRSKQRWQHIWPHGK